jgi:peptide deformylase
MINNVPKLLRLVDYDNLILRNQVATVSFPLSAQDKDIIANMKYSIQPLQLKLAGAPWESAVGMAANQWGINKSIFLYCPTADTINQLEVIINPSYESAEPLNQDQLWEGCFSVPCATGNIQRYLSINVVYQNENGEIIKRQLSGWEARVWQHENDHLNGFLYDDPRAGKCLEKKVFANRQQVEEFYEKLKTNN